MGRKNIIVEGHGRVEAAKLLGLDAVPTIRLDDMTDEERRAYGIAHNKTAEMSKWDEDALKVELEGLKEMGMERFGFLDNTILPDYSDMFEDAVEKEKKVKIHICPHCGAQVEG